MKLMEWKLASNLIVTPLSDGGIYNFTSDFLRTIANLQSVSVHISLKTGEKKKFLPVYVDIRVSLHPP